MLENRDLLLGANSHDFETTGFELHIAEGTQATAQRIKIRLKLFLGEWFLDLLAGIPYYQDILIRNPDINKVNALIREAILTTPTVLSIDSYEYALNTTTRTFSVNFRCTTSNGTIESDIELP